ncbi:hypothetical protein NXS19_008543 [Fusarium pseudograminearum]|nr:hypothetical protein NXS19_008543 [Fusarium pseudograminearum]
MLLAMLALSADDLFQPAPCIGVASSQACQGSPLKTAGLETGLLVVLGFYETLNHCTDSDTVNRRDTTAT